ncbi:MAG: hypothetical protein GY839_16895 [candidate division Zixibacteria bacterium]|nr:hypothetical protein [candidate division Zixibacteria bacterium]
MQFLLPPQMPDFILWFGFGSLSLFILFIFAKMKWRKVNLAKSKIFWGAWIIFAPAFYLIVMIGWIFLASYCPSNEFSSLEWRNNPEKRIELIDDLVDSKKLDGLTEEKVIELLGKPVDSGRGFYRTENEITYYLGPERGLIRIDSEWLSILIKDGKVDSYNVWRD